MPDTLTITLGGPKSDRVLMAVTRVAEQLALAPSEAVALLIGLGMRAALESGLISAEAMGERMPRSELLKEMMSMVAEAEEFET